MGRRFEDDGREEVTNMTSAVESLILDLLEWVADRDRTYDEVMDAWRTSCPRLPVWEDANGQGFIATERVSGRSFVRVTPAGFKLLQGSDRAVGTRDSG
jgi:hypothetical protein